MHPAPLDEWEQHLAKAQQALRVEPVRTPRSPRRRQYVGLLVLPLVVLAIAWCFPRQLEGVAFAVWVGGGLWAGGVLALYALSDRVSHEAKEAALCFLLGDLIVLGLLLLNPV